MNNDDIDPLIELSSNNESNSSSTPRPGDLDDSGDGDVDVIDVPDELVAEVIKTVAKAAASTETQSVATTATIAEDDDDDIDETLFERLYGLTEMFPETVRNGVWSLGKGTFTTVKCLVNFSKAASWILFSSATIFIAPVILEVERSQMQQMMQRQMLLGPGAGAGMMGMPPPPTR